MTAPFLEASKCSPFGFGATLLTDPRFALPVRGGSDRERPRRSAGDFDSMLAAATELRVAAEREAVLTRLAAVMDAAESMRHQLDGLIAYVAAAIDETDARDRAASRRRH